MGKTRGDRHGGGGGTGKSVNVSDLPDRAFIFAKCKSRGEPRFKSKTVSCDCDFVKLEPVNE